MRRFISAGFIERFFYHWQLLLVFLNFIPMGNGMNRSLTGNKVGVFRLDYLIHFAMILFFAIIWGVGKHRNVNWFAKHETLKYCTLLILTGIGLELLQLALPWRTFNPVDMLFNLIGAASAVAIIIVSQLIANLKRVKR
ncbi:MAG TPA: VanZ family protein [Candidatus Cloacimonadota bacterium]|nr:VanZ family protein [Candidatus Cloacimonadota bacterium]